MEKRWYIIDEDGKIDYAKLLLILIIVIVIIVVVAWVIKILYYIIPIAILVGIGYFVVKFLKK